MNSKKTPHTTKWASLLLAAGAAAPIVQAEDAPKKPHIILLMSDQHRGDSMGCSGCPAVVTPTMDALAKDGNLFVNGYTSLPSSTPARATLLTGMSPWNHGMLGYANVAERYPHEKPRILNSFGYLTAAVGKMHWNPQNNNHGLHSMLTDESGRIDSPYYKSDYRKWFNTQALGLDPDATKLGWNDHAAKSYQLPEHLHPTAWTGQTAVDTIKGYQSDKPLYLKVSFARPHTPFDPPQRLLDKIKAQAASTPAKPYMGDWIPQAWKDKTDPLKEPSAAVGNFGDDYAINSRLHYYANITFVDEQLGDIIQALKDKDMYDNALIFYVSDHGEMAGDHCLWRKTYAYEGSSNIPFIVKLPKGYPTHIQAGEKIEYPVELRDVLPTMIGINKGKQPKAMDGFSLLKIYDSENPEWREYIDLEHSTCYFKENYWTALTDGKMKYIWFLHTGEEQLFDLEKDPGEEHEASKDAEYQDVLEHMRAAMVKHLSIRGEEWVKDGKLQPLKRTIVLGPNYPRKDNIPSKGNK